MFDTHPPDYHPLFIFGKQTYENRYSQLYVTDSNVGNSYKYSGTSKECITCDSTVPDQKFVLDLCQVANQLLKNGLLLDEITSAKTTTSPSSASSSIPAAARTEKSTTGITQKDTTTTATNNDCLYNCCLVNWYQPQHTIGLHSDDEMEMDLNVPIMSLSWGGPRRFLLRPKPKTVDPISNLHDILLEDGDLLIMGGYCQQEFKHEIPKVRKKDGIVGNRISWTIRCMKSPTNTTNEDGATATTTTRKKRKRRTTTIEAGST